MKYCGIIKLSDGNVIARAHLGRRDEDWITLPSALIEQDPEIKLAVSEMQTIQDTVELEIQITAGKKRFPLR